MRGIEPARREPERIDHSVMIRKMVVQRIAGAAFARRENDLRRRRFVARKLVGVKFRRMNGVIDRNRREVDRRLKLLGIAAVRTDLAHQFRRQRPPDFQFADIHRENRRVQFVRRDIGGRIFVELGIVGVLHRTGVIFTLRADPPRIEKSVLAGERRTNFFRQGIFVNKRLLLFFFIKSSRSEGLVRSHGITAEPELIQQIIVLRRHGADGLKPYRISACILKKRVCSIVGPIGIHDPAGDVEVLFLDTLAHIGIERDLIRHGFHAERLGIVDDRLFFRFAALFIFRIAHISLRSCLVPRSRVDIDFERPDDVQFLLRAPEDLDLPRILAGIADRPQIVLLLAGAVLIDVDLVVLRFVRQTARHARKEFVRGKVARLGLQLIADFDVDLRLLGLKHLYKLVGEHRALVRRFIETRINEKERPVAALVRFQLSPVQFDIAVGVVH